MTIRVKSETGLRFGYKPCLRQPRRPEMTFIVRGRYHLEPGRPLSLALSDEITEELVEKTRQDSEEAADALEETRIDLGQGTLTGDAFEDTDDAQMGEVIYPSDFADYKAKADVMLRGTCHPSRRADSESEVTFAVGRWSKTLKIVGHRVWVDRTAGGEHTSPQPIDRLRVDYAHAYGGPGFANNPVGKGHVEKLEGEEEDVYQPPRSERSATMPSEQLPNVLYADGKEHKGGVPAGFGPLSPRWPCRSQKLGTRYDEQWLDERAPYFAEDMDPTYFNAAPPDQQLDRFLKGDEEVRLTNLHPDKRDFTVQLPALRVRVFVRDVQEQCREIPMNLDTLFADVDDASLYLTWRGIAPVAEEDLTDVAFGLIVTEPLADRPRPAATYIAELEAFAADPVGVKDAFPEGFMEFAENASKLEDATDDEIEALLQSAEGRGPLSAALTNVFGPFAPPQLDQIDRQWNQAIAREGIDEADMNAKLTESLKKGLRGGDADEDGEAQGGVGIRLPVREGEVPIFPIGVLYRAQERRLVETKKKLPDDAPPEAVERIDAALERLRNNPELLAADPRYRPYDENDPPPDEPGPGADLLGRDLSDRDLSGVDLSGADLQCAILSRTNLRGANLAGAKLGGARLHRVDLSEADLSDVDLTSTTFDRVDARGANLSGTRLDLFRANKSDFSDARLGGAVGLLALVSDCTLERTDASGSELELCAFDACRMEGARFTQATLSHARFDGCDGKRMSLERATLLGTSFNECALREAIVDGATGVGPIWFQTGLQKASFRKADFTRAHFFGVDALEADFTRANVPDARFDRAILRRARFERANLRNADLRKAVLSKASFDKASLYGAQLTQTAGTDVSFSGANMEGVNSQRSQIANLAGNEP